MMTTDESRWSDVRAIKAARVRRLTDPLGAAGFRATRARIRRESQVRTWLFAAVIASYLAITGALFASETPTDAGASDPARPVVVVPVDAMSAPHGRTSSS